MSVVEFEKHKHTIAATIHQSSEFIFLSIPHLDITLITTARKAKELKMMFAHKMSGWRVWGLM